MRAATMPRGEQEPTFMEQQSSMTNVTPGSPRAVTCGELTAADAGQTVLVRGWVHRRRDHGGLIFLDIRDHWGLTQVVCNPAESAEAAAAAEEVRNEYVVAAVGS